MSNIFEGAEFGDKFRTREGWYAVYDGTTYYGPCGKGHIVHELRYRGIHNKYCVITIKCENDGILAGSKTEHNFDIIGKWEEPINEEELDNLAKEYAKTTYIEEGCGGWEDGADAFKDGYRKAKGYAIR